MTDFIDALIANDIPNLSFPLETEMDFSGTILELEGSDSTDAADQTPNALLDQQANLALPGLIDRLASQLKARFIPIDIVTNSFHGGSGNDLINGDGNANVLCGNGGDDRIYGYGGNDVIFGGDGNDYLDSGSPRLSLDGDASLYGEAGNDILVGGNGNDFLAGGDGNDELFGRRGNDMLRGHAGDDLLFGDAGDDHLIGDAGNDTLNGGAGRDRIDGYGTSGIEYDTLIGGEGSDTFVLGGAWGVSYQGLGYVRIQDWEWHDYIEVLGSAEQYSLRQVHWGADTAIVHNDNPKDFIALIVNSTNVNIHRDFVFV